MATGAAVAAAVAAAASAAAGAYGSHQQSKAAKTQKRNQRRALAKEKMLADQERRTQIDNQRESMLADGSGTKGFSSSGVKANVDRLG